MDALIAQFSRSEIVTLRQIASRWTEDDHPLWQLSLFLDAAEFFMKVHAAHAFELFRDSKLHEKQPDIYNEIRQGLRLPTIGSWQNSFSKAADALADALMEERNSKRADHRSVSLRRTVENVEAFHSIAPSIRKALAGLVTLRNERAHGATPPREEALRLVKDHVDELRALADPFLTENPDNRFALEYSQPASDPLRSPTWAKVVLVHSNGRVELFPWCVARIERDVPSAIHIFNRSDREKSGTWRFDYLDHGARIRAFACT